LIRLAGEEHSIVILHHCENNDAGMGDGYPSDALASLSTAISSAVRRTSQAARLSLSCATLFAPMIGAVMTGWLSS